MVEARIRDFIVSYCRIHRTNHRSLISCAEYLNMNKFAALELSLSIRNVFASPTPTVIASRQLEPTGVMATSMTSAINSLRARPIAWLLATTVALALTGCDKGESTPPTDGQEAPLDSDSAASEAATTAGEASIHTEEVEYEGGGLKLKGYLAYNESQSGPRPGVLIVHEWWGHDEYVRKRARMLAEMGYTALALDMYGDGKHTAHPDDAKKFSSEVFENLESSKARFVAAKTLLEQHETTDPEKTAAIGYCFGGGVALHMARFGVDLDGVASFHGSLGTQTPAEPGAVNAKLFVAHGAADPFVPPDVVEAFQQEMATAGVEVEFHAYPGVVHSFTNPDATALGEKFELPLAYDAEADQQSWAALETFLATLFETTTP